jgi:hypothetical protein
MPASSAVHAAPGCAGCRHERQMRAAHVGQGKMGALGVTVPESARVSPASALVGWSGRRVLGMKTEQVGTGQ